MSDNSSEQEPSIEEILASIRQIISDDDEEATEEVLESPVREGHDDVMELTEDDLVEEPEPEPEVDPEEVEMRDSIEEEEEVMTQTPEPVPSDILSSGTQAAAMDSIAKLTKNMPINKSRSYDGVTLEDIVREMLHPMLREWMDDNLPPMVERIVQKELEKLARRAFDD